MQKLKKEYYTLEEIAKSEQWDCTLEDLLYFGGTGELEICVYVYKGTHLLYEEKWSREEEQEKRRISPNSTFIGDKMILLPEGLYPAWLLPGDWITPGRLGPESLQNPREPLAIKVIRAQKEGHIFLDKGEYRDSLFITHEEIERFKAAYESADNNNIKKKRPKQRVRPNELHDVIWRVYCDLEERHDAPTAGQVWQKLQRHYKEYDTEEIIQEITKGPIHWIDFRGSEQSLKESSFKGTLCKIKKKRNINKNSN
jgi:hypothetical protein